jgi:hypothetical protein
MDAAADALLALCTPLTGGQSLVPEEILELDEDGHVQPAVREQEISRRKKKR